MAADATGPTTSPDTLVKLASSDAPRITNTGGINAIVDSVQTALTTSYVRPSGAKSTNHGLFWNGTNWVPGFVAAANIASATITETQISPGALTNASIATAANITPNKAKTAYALVSRNTGTQAFGALSGIWTWDTAYNDTNSFWAGGNPTRLTVPYTGLYEIESSFWAQGTAPTPGADIVTIRKNGATNIAFIGDSSGTNISSRNGTNVPVKVVLSLTAAEYVELVYNRSAATGVTTFAVPFLDDMTHLTQFGWMRIKYLGA